MNQANMLRRVITNQVNRVNTNEIPAMVSTSIYRSVSKAHQQEREKQKAMPDINPETDADRWTDPANPKFVEEEMNTPKQLKKDEQMRSDEFKSEFQRTDPNLAWRGYTNPEALEEEIDKKGIQNR